MVSHSPLSFQDQLPDRCITMGQLDLKETVALRFIAIPMGRNVLNALQRTSGFQSTITRMTTNSLRTCPIQRKTNRRG